MTYLDPRTGERRAHPETVRKLYNIYILPSSCRQKRCECEDECKLKDKIAFINERVDAWLVRLAREQNPSRVRRESLDL